MSQILTLTSDFGEKDWFVGVMKGVIFSINPKVKIVDLNHNIEAFNKRQATFNLIAARKYFPKDAIHVVVVDPGVGSKRRAILAKTERGTFIGPDNGILSSFIDENSTVVELTNEKYFQKPVSKTFHGRDIFSSVAAWHSTGVKPKDFGDPIEDWIELDWPEMERVDDNTLCGEIVYIDRFGNAISNIPAEALPKNVNPSITVAKQSVSKLANNFAEGSNKELSAIVASHDFLEFFLNQDSAQSRFSIKVGDQVEIKL